MGELRVGLSLSGNMLDLALTAFSSRLSALSDPLGEFGKTMMGSVARNFDEQGRPLRWKPLAESTIKRKGSDAILVDTGRLRGSVGFRAGRDSLTLYAVAPYASIHQRGGKAGRGGSADIPARPFLIFQDDDVVRLKALLAGYLLEQY